jgi:hypothetical protein
MDNYNQINKMASNIKPLRFKIIATVITVVLILLLFLLVPLIVHGAKAINLATNSWDKSNQLIDSVSDKDWDNSVLITNSIGSDLRDLNHEIGKLGLITKFPKIKNDISATRQFLDVIDPLIDSYSETFAIFAELEDGGVELDIASILENKQALGLINDKRNKLSVAEGNIALARESFDNINILNFSGFFSPRLLEGHALLDQLIDSSDLAIPAISNLVDLLGFEEEKNYLVVFQNNMEMRPTGGFIGSYGIVTVKDGEIINIFTDDVYNLDKLSEGKMERLAPAPMLTYNKQKYWYMRDANWYANWPDSAKNIADFFYEERTHAELPVQNIDGVVAITPDFIANLLEVVGPIENYGVVFSADNFAIDLERFVEFDYEKYGISPNQRKAIIGAISEVLIERVESGISDNFFDLWLAFKKNIDEKHILVYIFDEEIQKYFSDRNWAGEIMATEGDYLMIVDSNFASLKTDSVIERSIKRTINLNESGDLIARVEMTYNHTGDFVTDLVTRYRTYTKMYIPNGSWVERGWIREGGVDISIDTTSDLEYGNEYNKSYAAYFVVIEPGDSKTVILEYKLPDELKRQYENGNYSLIIQKQPGMPGHNLEIDLNFDKMISAYNSSSLPSKFGGKSIKWGDNLSVDRVYKLKF